MGVGWVRLQIRHDCDSRSPDAMRCCNAPAVILLPLLLLLLIDRSGMEERSWCGRGKEGSDICFFFLLSSHRLNACGWMVLLFYFPT